jgi:hypothetical protein
VPGPDTDDPRDKIWHFLIEEYHFGPETLRTMSYREMKLYVEPRLAKRKTPNPQPNTTGAPLADPPAVDAQLPVPANLFDRRMLGRMGFEPAGKVRDTMNAPRLSDEQLRYAALDAAVVRRLCLALQPMIKEAELGRVLTLERRTLVAVWWLRTPGC